MFSFTVPCRIVLAKPEKSKPWFKVNGPILIKANNLSDFLLATLDNEAFHQNRGLLFKKRICSIRSNFFSLKVDPLWKQVAIILQ